MCEAKMDPESPEESDKQNMIDIKSTARNTNSEPPSPPTGPAAAASPPQTVTTATSTGAAAGTTPPIKHCPLTPQSQGTVGDDDDEEEDVHEQDADVSDQVEDEEDGHHNHHQHLTPARSRHLHHIRHRNHHHHHHKQEQPYNYGINKMEHDDDNVTSEDDDEISVGGSPSPSPTLVISPSNHHFHPDLTSHSINSKRNIRHLGQNPEEEYFKPLKKLRMLKVESTTSQNAVGVKSFSISDILSHKPSQKKTHTTKSSSNSSGSSNCSSRTIDIENVVANTHHHQQQQRIVRPWDPHQQSNKSNGRRNSSDSSPLDALFQMTSKTFEGLNGHHEGSEFGGQGNAHQAFNARQPPKKKRKSRTAFTNHQIFELEKRFLYQKYLSPADRDDIAHQLGLTNAQVITWFQNRRAKLKRDMEEMKKDAESLHMISAHKTFLESAHDLALLKKRAQSMDMSSAAAAAVAATAFHHISSPTSSSQSSHSPINLTSESPPSTH